MRKLYTPLLAILLPVLSMAQVKWDFTTASPTSGTPVANISTVSDVSQGNNNGTTALITTSSVSSGYTGSTGGGNAGAAARTGVINTAAAGSAYFEITLTPVSGGTIQVTQIDFGSRSTSTGPQAYDIRTSIDNYAAAAATGSFTNNSAWALKTNTLSLTAAAGSALTIRIYGYAGTGSPSANTANWRIDDLAVTASATASTPVPFVSATPGTLSFTTVAGTASATQPVNVSGSNLTDVVNVSVTAPFELSADNITWSTSVSLSPTAGTLASTAVSARVGAGATAGAYSQNLSVSSTGAGTQSVSLSGTVTSGGSGTPNIVINQVYGGGGNSDAYYKNDFIELYNNESTPVSLAGWSVQYLNAAGTGTWSATALTGTIPAHGFYLVQEAAGANASAVALPTPDASGTLALSATAGKVILCNVTTAQTGANPSSAAVIDKAGYGSAATGYEGSGPIAGLSNTTAAYRITDGVDNNDNATDFAVGNPLPRNTGYINTPPAIVSLSPPNGVTGIPATLVPTMVFDKPLVKGTGNITIYENGSGTPISVASGAVVISNRNTVTINTTLLPNKTYYINIDAGAFQDTYGNAFAGITNSTTWVFTTYNSAVATTLPAIFDFQNCTGSGLLPNGFTQYSRTGAQVWDCTIYGRNGASASDTANAANGVQMNGYANGIDNLNEDWLVSPKLDLTGTIYPLLSFYSRNAFAGDPLQLKISTDYTGSGDPSLATWTDLNGKFPSKGSDVWQLSAGINLSSYKQSSVYIAFVYTSTTDDGSRWTLDDISLVNSSTPPAPSLTLSANSLEFGYTATGSNSVKTLTLTANDLVGDVTLTTTGNFQVSADGTNFSSSVTVLQATANNIPLTLYVRFAPGTNNIQYSETLSVAISDSTGGVTLKGNSIDPASTLNMVNWNLEWFATPDPTLGPANKSLQQDNVAIVLKSLPADLFVLQEVVNEHALDSIVNTMPGYTYKINNYGSHSNTMESSPSPLNQVQKLAFVYKTAKFSNVSTTPLLSLGINTTADLSNPYYNDWASGRFPFMMTADVTLSDNNGGFITHPMHFINIHAKANTAPVLTSYARRLAGAKDLDSIIKADYINDPVIIAGDYNDDLNQTITAGITPPVTSYKSFTIDDVALYTFPTMPLSPAGQHSDVSYSSVIDNVITNIAAGKYYLPASANVLSDVSNLVAKYGTTTTDHYPVFTQYSFSTAAALPVKLLSFTAVKQGDAVKLDWATSQEINSKSFEVERSAGTGFTKIGTVEAKGYSSVKTSYSFFDRQPLSGLNLYRLKQLDLDGKFEYSPVVKIVFSRQPGIRITPNPASTFVNIGIDNSNEAITIQIIDLNGRLLKQQVLAPGAQNTPVTVSGLAKGLYTVKAIGSSGMTTQKVLIQ